MLLKDFENCGNIIDMVFVSLLLIFEFFIEI